MSPSAVSAAVSARIAAGPAFGSAGSTVWVRTCFTEVPNGSRVTSSRSLKSPVRPVRADLSCCSRFPLIDPEVSRTYTVREGRRSWCS